MPPNVLSWSRCRGAVCSIFLVLAGCSDPTTSSPHDTPDAASVSTTPVTLRVTVRNVSVPGATQTSTGADLPVVFAPGVHFVHAAGPVWFTEGDTASPALERLAEDGDVAAARTELEARGEGSVGVFGADELDVSYDDSPILPGDEADFFVTAKPGDSLELGMMWAQSNDVFVATMPGGAPLFDGDAPRTGRITDLALWDAGTEVNQEPGVGDTQAARQRAPGEGAAEGGVITRLTGGRDVGGYAYPSLEGTLEVVVDRAPAGG